MDLQQQYPWLSSGLDYFTARLYQALGNARFALQQVTEHAQSRAEQELGNLCVTCLIGYISGSHHMVPRVSEIPG